MQGKKELLSKLMFRAKLLALLKEMRRDILVVFGYHRIRAHLDSAQTPFADDVYGQTAEEFDDHVAWLKENVHVLSEEELIACTESGMRPGRLGVALTFDDGYADNYTLAYPILKKHGVPAIFFIPSKLIEERMLGWWDLIAWILKRTDKPSIVWEGRTFHLPSERDDAIRHFHRMMQLEPQSSTQDLIARLGELCGVEPPDPAVRHKELMTWEQLREVARDGIAIGSHTHSHRVLATLDERAQREELEQSKAMLEEKLGQPVRTIAYPVGGYRHFTEQTRRMARETGYKLGFSFCTGINRWGDISPYDVKRLGPPLSVSMLASTTVLPEVFDWDQASGYGG
jgi:peptidoglycan/xylan/chitin deacetylase (PgdA/CDA1 family)